MILFLILLRISFLLAQIIDSSNISDANIIGLNFGLKDLSSWKKRIIYCVTINIQKIT